MRDSVTNFRTYKNHIFMPDKKYVEWLDIREVVDYYPVDILLKNYLNINVVPLIRFAFENPQKSKYFKI